MNDMTRDAGRRTKILIIDDEESIRVSLLYHFEDCGFDARSVVSGEEGLLMMGQDTPDVVIVDLRLPEMDGLEFMREAIGIWPDVHYVIYTGSPAANIPEELIRKTGVSSRIFFKPLTDLSEMSNYILNLVAGS